MTEMTPVAAQRVLKVLLVEDDPIHALIISRALKHRHVSCRLRHVTDGGPALDILFRRGGGESLGLEEYPDLVLLDLQLPGTSGFDALRAIRAPGTGLTLPVIVISSSDLPSDITLSYALGANAYVVKPGDFDTFVHHMSALYEFWGEVANLGHS